jgi:hypothetical protein
MRSAWFVVAATLLALSGPLSTVALAHGESGDLLTGAEWDKLAMVTGVHFVKSKHPSMMIRVLEADGSSTVALDPIALFLVALHGDGAEEVQRIWRLPGTLSHFREVIATSCGVDVRGDVDVMGDDGLITGTRPVRFQVCFISPDGKLQDVLKLTRDADDAPAANRGSSHRASKKRSPH